MCGKLQCVTKVPIDGPYPRSGKEEDEWLSGRCQLVTIQFAQQFVSQ
jgi:hypothetical protein